MSNVRIVLDDAGGFFSVPDAEVLIVLLHAYNRTPKNLQRIAEVVREEYESSDVYAPRIPVNLFSWADPDTIAAGLIDDLAKLPRIDSYRSIVLVGHSLGAVMARKIWAIANGATPAATVETGNTRTWADKIDRIVLVAALNRGWMVSSALDPARRLSWTLGAAWGNICRYLLKREPAIFGFRRGAPFLTMVRLQCLAVAAAMPAKLPMVVQLLGTADDYVAPTDNLDLATGRDFHYIEVAEATHGGLVDLDDSHGPNSALASFRLALKGDAASLKDRSLKLDDVFDVYEEVLDDHDILMLPSGNLSVKHLIFVIHGIRDRGFWTRRIAREVKSMARRESQPCRSVTSTYGYFPMGPFLLPWVRRGKVEWLLDQYVTAKSLYPKAEFSYIGHSNGTYLLAKALALCPAISFRRVVFGGSVVRSRFDWSSLVPGRVSQVLNYVATADNVVAVFPQGMERLNFQDLGGAGHDGFTDPAVVNLRHVKGGHGAALANERWQEMAKFVIDGTLPPMPSPAPPQSTVTMWLARVAPAIWVVLALVVIGLGALLLAPIGPTGWIFALLFLLYLYLVSVILTRA